MATALSSAQPTAAAAPLPSVQRGSAPVSIEQLRDLQLPEAIGAWPPAPGWWLLSALAIGLLLWLTTALLRHRRRNRYRRLALQELALLQRSPYIQTDPQRWLQQLNQLLRRTALAGFPDQPVAPLSGNDWSDFLYRSSRLPGFRQRPGQTLAEGPYRPLTADRIDTEVLLQLARQWIKRHRRRHLQKTAATDHSATRSDSEPETTAC